LSGLQRLTKQHSIPFHTLQGVTSPDFLISVRQNKKLEKGDFFMNDRYMLAHIAYKVMKEKRLKHQRLKAFIKDLLNQDLATEDVFAKYDHLMLKASTFYLPLSK